MDKRLRATLTDLQIVDIFDALQAATNTKTDTNKQHKTTEPADSADASSLKDPKLVQLWNSAQHAGFTAQQLTQLLTEFYHHQTKVFQYEKDIKKLKT